MQAIDIRVSDQPTPEETETIFRNLVLFNEVHGGPAHARHLAVMARVGDEIVGGLTGLTHWNWMHVRLLWVADAYRGQGLGRKLLLTAEAEALQRGCEHVHLDTMSYQAQGFYERLGYTVFGRLDDYPPGHAKIFLQKRGLSQHAIRLTLPG